MTKRLTFGQRQGLRPVSETIQTDGMNHELRNGLWNAFYFQMQETDGFFAAGLYDTGLIHSFAKAMWADHFGLPVDRLPTGQQMVYAALRDRFFKSEWWQVYEFLEAALLCWPSNQSNDARDLQKSLNVVLERELSGFRFVGGIATQITSTEEIASIEDALRDDRFAGVSEHLGKALRHLSSKPQPDLQNSIKESISAVEAMAQIVTKKRGATLPDALESMKRSGHPIHTALRQGLEKLYAYTSDAEGIRHALMEESTLTVADARFMLVACSAFVNYLKATMNLGQT